MAKGFVYDFFGFFFKLLNVLFSLRSVDVVDGDNESIGAIGKKK